jgi:hypothetical protein
MFDEYFCVFHADQDPSQVMPIAIFDRYQFLMEFLRACPRNIKFREENMENDILTVADWKALRLVENHMPRDPNAPKIVEFEADDDSLAACPNCGFSILIHDEETGFWECPNCEAIIEF